MDARIVRQHWFCLVPLLPAAEMIWIHEAFGISNAMGGKLVEERDATVAELLFNYAMVAACYLGIMGFIAHAFWVSNRGYSWIALKLIALAIGWYALLAFGVRE